MIDFSAAAQFVWLAFVDWLNLFVAPLKNLDMLWIIVPIWGVWLFSEIFQEKKGTSFGNAITNGAVMLFVGVDWIRFIVRDVGAGNSAWGADTVSEIVIALFNILTSISIIILGIKGKQIVKYFGRVRESTYLLLMFTPIIYGVVDFTLRNFLIIAVFFPVFYLLVEVLDRLLPNPQTFELDEEKSLNKELSVDSSPGLNSDFSQDVFGANTSQARQPWQGRR